MKINQIGCSGLQPKSVLTSIVLGVVTSAPINLAASKDSCWRFEQDKKDALAEDLCPDCGRDMNALGMYRDYIHYISQTRKMRVYRMNENISSCSYPECTGPSEPIPPEGLVELHPFGCVVVWGGDGQIETVMHPFAYYDLMLADQTPTDILKRTSVE